MCYVTSLHSFTDNINVYDIKQDLFASKTLTSNIQHNNIGNKFLIVKLLYFS